MGQLIAIAAYVWVIPAIGGDNPSGADPYTMLLTGLTAVAAGLLLIGPFLGDIEDRRKTGLMPVNAPVLPGLRSSVLLFLMGAGYADICTMVLSLFRDQLPMEEYEQGVGYALEGQTFLSLVFWVGIICPVAEEIVFRFMVYLRLRDNHRFVSAALVSALMFGVYHGNIPQGIYASVLGFVFAALVEYTGRPAASVFMHIGANTWSLVMSELVVGFLNRHPEISTETIGRCYLSLEMLLVLTVIFGTVYYRKQYHAGRVKRR